MYLVYTMHVTSQNIDGGATEADGGASAPVGPSVATPLAKMLTWLSIYIIQIYLYVSYFIAILNLYFLCQKCQ